MSLAQLASYQVQWIVCVSLWIEKAVEVCFVHDKRGVPSSTARRNNA
jgi:hypothetical protein